MTQRFPRSLNEAFGPYTSQEIYDDPMPCPTRKEWAIIIGFSLFACTVIVGVGAWIILG